MGEITEMAAANCQAMTYGSRVRIQRRRSNRSRLGIDREGFDLALQPGSINHDGTGAIKLSLTSAGWAERVWGECTMGAYLD